MADPPVAIDAKLRKQIADNLTNLLGRMLRLDEPLSEDTRLDNELELSSSQSAQLVLDLENDLSIMVDVEDLDAEEMRTMGELADYVAGHSTPQ